MTDSNRTDRRASRVLRAMLFALKIGTIVAIYFSLCVLIVLFMIGARS